MTLRQRHTEGAILYEKKLKPFLKSLNEGKGTSPTFLCDLPQVAALSGSAKTFLTWMTDDKSLTEVSLSHSPCTHSALGDCVSCVQVQAEPLGLSQGSPGFS